MPRLVLPGGLGACRHQDAMPARVRPDELGCALEALGAVARMLGDRFGLQRTSPWALISVLTRGRMLAMAPAG